MCGYAVSVVIVLFLIEYLCIMYSAKAMLSKRKREIAKQLFIIGIFIMILLESSSCFYIIMHV